jgi:hypothetical protein
MNGLKGTLSSLNTADPDFIMGRCLAADLSMAGSSSYNSEANFQTVQSITELAKSQMLNLSRRELLHVKATQMLFYGDLRAAADYLEEILIENPTDIFALKMITSIHFFQGTFTQMKDTVARVLPLYPKALPMYSYLHGMYAFAAVQDNFYDTGVYHANLALEMNRFDTSATHSLAHFHDHKCTVDDGIQFLRSTEENWSVNNRLAGHHYWHLALYHLDKGQHDIVIELLDDNILKPAIELNNYLNMTDAVTLMYRLRIDTNNNEQCNIIETQLSHRFKALGDKYQNEFLNNGFLFSDLHLLMLMNQTARDEDEKKGHINRAVDCYLANIKSDSSDQLIPSEFNLNLSEGESSYHYKDHYKSVNKELRAKLFEAIYSYDCGDYETVVRNLKSIKYDIHKLGSSNAQRDIFFLILIDSAMKSSLKEDNKYALTLINERMINRPNSSLTERLAFKFNSLHQ